VTDPRLTPLPEGVPLEDKPGLLSKVLRRLIGAPKDVEEKGIFHSLALIPFLAWVGLGADGLSSSSYGPEEAFKTLGEHTYLSVGIAMAMVMTVVIISAAYSRIIEAFPHGGGGYVVATKLLGDRAGVVSGSALLVDYMLTITTSIAAAGDALFSFIPINFFHVGSVVLPWVQVKLATEVVFVFVLTMLNIRGVKESVIALTPIFLLFLVTHVILIGGAFFVAAPHLPQVAAESVHGFRAGMTTLGIIGMVKLFVHSYSLGGGTYTGIEAVSNGLPIMREPKVKTAQRTMLYMAASLAITASGLLVCYLLLDAHPMQNQTMNAVLSQRFAGTGPIGSTFTIVTLVSEGALLVVAAQAGFVDGPRVMANMAIDNWLPRRLAALSDRLTTQNGVLIMGSASLAALLLTGGSVDQLVVMYSINVFLTFSLSMFGMLRRNLSARKNPAPGDHSGHIALFGVGFVMCATILAVTITEKFLEGGWITLVVTTACVGFCFWVRSHYSAVTMRLDALDNALGDLPMDPGHASMPPMNRNAPTAVVLVSRYGGLGLHTALNIFKSFPNYFKNLVFVTAGVIDSGGFKGEEEIAALKERTQENLDKYVEWANRMGIPAASRMTFGTDAVADAEALCMNVSKEFHHATFFAGQVIFHRERWYDRWLHNQTAFAIQKRLQWAGLTMVILPVRVR
jgi:amino acid transporter